MAKPRNQDATLAPEEALGDNFQDMTAMEAGPLEGNGDRAPMQGNGDRSPLAGNGDRIPE